MKKTVEAVSNISAVLLICIALLFGANWIVEGYLRANPEILMTRAERINEQTRSVRESMIPSKKITEWYALESADELKPMWNEFYNGRIEFESYVHFRARAMEGKYYGVSEHGFRKVRNQGPWPLDKEKFNIFFFGGSTLFGVGPYWASTASYFQEHMNNLENIEKEVNVYNFGRSGYFSAQEIILFQRLLTDGHVPDMVIFIDGPNDFCWSDGQPSSWQTLSRHFNSVNDAAASRAAAHGVITEWNKIRSFAENLPLARFLNALIARAVEEPLPQISTPSQAVDEAPESDETLNVIIDRYLSIKKQIVGVSNAFGIKSVFVWQPIPTYKYDNTKHLFYPDRLGCHVNSKFGYPMMAQRMQEADGFGENFIWAADMQKNLKEALYIDAFHYTAPMSKRISAFITESIVKRGLLENAVQQQ